MPKVTNEHVEARRRQILDAARCCFVRRGFNQTTMKDICQESGLSPGAIYNYFRGKDKIIEAIGEESTARAVATIQESQNRLRLPQLVEFLVEYFFLPVGGPEAEATLRVDVECWAEALRNESMARQLRQNIAAAKDALAQVIRQGQAEGRFSPELDARTVAAVLLALHQGLRVLKAIAPYEVDVTDFTRVVQALLTGQFWRGQNQQQQY